MLFLADIINVWTGEQVIMSFNMTDNEMENMLGDYGIIPAIIDDKRVSNLETASKLRSASKMASFLFRL